MLDRLKSERRPKSEIRKKKFKTARKLMRCGARLSEPQRWGNRAGVEQVRQIAFGAAAAETAALRRRRSRAVPAPLTQTKNGLAKSRWEGQGIFDQPT
jgi:hypothetical protein